MARFLVDEDLPRSLAGALVQAGLDTEHVVDVGLRGKPDAEIFEYAATQRLAIITADVGFGNVLTYALGTHAGIVLVRFPSRTPISAINAAILAALQLLPEDDLDGNLVVIEPHRIRIRRKPKSSPSP
jgi:predicted nuclease of predicted toxin-antitoxin system